MLVSRDLPQKAQSVPLSLHRCRSVRLVHDRFGFFGLSTKP